MIDQKLCRLLDQKFYSTHMIVVTALNASHVRIDHRRSRKRDAELLVALWYYLSHSTYERPRKKHRCPVLVTKPGKWGRAPGIKLWAPLWQPPLG